MATVSNCVIGLVGTYVGKLVAILLFSLVCRKFNLTALTLSYMLLYNLGIPMYLTGCYVISGKLGIFSWLSCVYCYIVTMIRLYSADGVWLVQSF